MIKKPPADQEHDREFTLQEAADLCARDYAYTASTARDLGLGHDEPRRPGSKGPLRRLLWASEVRALKHHFAGKEESPCRMGTYRFKLIKAVKGQNVQLKWAEENPDGSWDSHSLTSEDPARPELYDALGAFVGRLVESHRLQWDEEHEVMVVGLQYQRDKDGYLTGIIFEARAQLTETVWWAIKSVNLAVSDAQTKEGLLNTVEHEAGLYINGSRAQLVLEFGKGERPATERVAEAMMETLGDPDNPLTQDFQDALGEGSQVSISSGGRTVTLKGHPDQEAVPA